MKKIWMAIFINVALLIAVVALGLQLKRSMKSFETDRNPAPKQAEQNSKKPPALDKLASPLEQKAYYFTDFKDIPEKTIFSESRSIIPPEPPIKVTPQAAPLAQKPILVGITIAGNQSRALIIDPTAPVQNVTMNPTAPTPTAAASAMIAGPATPARMPSRPTQVVQVKRIGDVYQGYTLTSITPEGIVLESGNRREVIPLHEGSKKPQGGKTANLATRVVNIGGSGSTGSGASGAAGTGGGGGRGNPTAAAANQGGAGGAGGGRGGGGRGTGGGTSTQPTTGIMQILGLGDLGSGGQAQDVIRTLFGGSAGTQTISPDGSVTTPFGSVMPPMPGN